MLELSRVTAVSNRSSRSHFDGIGNRSVLWFVTRVCRAEGAGTSTGHIQKINHVSESRMEKLLQNLRFSLRMLGRNPGLTATVLAPLPYPEPNQLVMVWSKIQDNHNGISAGDYTDWKRQSTVFQQLCAFTGTNFNIATKDQPEYIAARVQSPELLQMIGEPPFLGRYFLPEEGIAGQEHVTVLTHKLWVKLGSNPHILGTAIRLDGQPYTVVGVQRAGIFDHGQEQLTVPLVFKPEQLN